MITIATKTTKAGTLLKSGVHSEADHLARYVKLSIGLKIENLTDNLLNIL